MKYWKTAAVIVAAGTLLTCNLFLAPMKGRWNPADPNNTLVALDKNIYPIVDGSLDNSGSKGDFFGTTLRVWYGTPMTDSLLRFNPMDFPVVIDSVSLQLYFASGTGSGTVAIYRIIQDWDPETLSWPQVVSGTFYDYSLVSNLYLNTTPQYYSTDVTEMVRKSLQEGRDPSLLLIIATTGNYDFDSSRHIYKPFLLVKGKGIP
jgi:hypothetical protein